LPAIPPMVKAPVVEPPPVIAKAAPPKVEPVRPEPVVKNDPPPPKREPIVEPPPQPPVPPKVASLPATLYGDQGRQPVAAAAPAPHTYMRARNDDSFYKLSNARVGTAGTNPRGAFMVQFEMTHRGRLFPTHLLIRFADDRTEMVAMPA